MIHIQHIVVILIFLIDKSKSKCGYESCHPVEPDMINVHLVPHSHDDVGWKYTMEEYYKGSNNDSDLFYLDYSVRRILNSVIEELMKDPDRRFIQVETSFFWMWWRKQSKIKRRQVIELVNSGRLEFVGGAWAMNDEAVTSYQSIIDQFTWGFRRLNDTFGECGRPRVGWQIDPFGHSREMASIFARLGFDGIFIGRIDNAEKELRWNTKTLEMIWKGSASLGKSAEIFTSILYDGYSAPLGFCFDVQCMSGDQIFDKGEHNNLKFKFQELANLIRQMAQYYNTNNILIPMGNDFSYSNATPWYTSIDALIRYSIDQQMTNNSKINVLYSTPSCYLKAVNKDGLKWPVKSDDFFPYSTEYVDYWTGYYTSRPTLKRFEKMGNNFLQVCKQLFTLSRLHLIYWPKINVLRDAMGVLQHHDAITGTEQQHVADDYSKMLSNGFSECEKLTKKSLNNLSKHKILPKLQFETCKLLNISQCGPSEQYKNFVVTLYNSLSRYIDHYVRLPVKGKYYTVQDPSGNYLEVQLVPVPELVRIIPGRESTANMELIFKAANIPPLGFKSFYVSEKETPHDVPHDARNEPHISLHFDSKLQYVVVNGSKHNIKQDFLYYNSKTFPNSGAYIFSPENSATPVSGKLDNKFYEGPLVYEVHQNFSDWVSQVIRVYKDENYIEFEWMVGPILLITDVGTEIISRFSSDIQNKGVFYTDSNGREIMKRIRNYRPTWHLELSYSENISANYYPVTSKISIRNKNGIEMAILTDRPQGGSSLSDGEIELMVHRRLLDDDRKGVYEPLNEIAFGEGLVARGKHYLIFGKSDKIAGLEKDLADKINLSPWIFISNVSTSFEEFQQEYKMEFSGLTDSLPPNIKILTLEPWRKNSVLLRLEHVFEIGEDEKLSAPVRVNLMILFKAFTIKSFRETTLGGNQWLNENEKLKWNLGVPLEKYVNSNKGKGIRKNWANYRRHQEINRMNFNRIYRHKVNNTDKNIIVMRPMEIRTFIVEIED